MKKTLPIFFCKICKKYLDFKNVKCFLMRFCAKS